jgi:alpha-glucosidase
MSQYRDFQNDENTFPYAEGMQFLTQLHANGQHYVPIVDSAIYDPNPENASDAYATYNRGLEMDAFMLNPDGELYIGAVWPGYTVFPDWIGAVLNGTGAFEWWSEEMKTWYANVSFDGIWIDMSEVSSFCVGSCGTGNLTLNPVHPPFSLPGEPGNIVYGYPEGFNITNATEFSSVQAASASAVALASSLAAAASTSNSPASSTGTIASSSTSVTTISSPTSYIRTTPTPGVRAIEYPPYVINNVQGALDVHAVSPNATHHGGTQEYDFHNLFGHQILNATYHALLGIWPTKRPFVIGRSTFAGSGKWAGHWGGDNASLWAYMFFSIPQALSFSLFGIPMFGVDTCGFNGNTDEELCNRWMQLSAFFPFYRNHNVLSAISQEPYVWASVTEATKTAMGIRYLLLPYMYTLFQQAHSTGSTVMRALAWEFPNDPTLASADRQFLLGGSLMITPVLAQGATSVDGVFPGVGKGEVWYDWYNQTAIVAQPGQNITIDAPLGHIPVYIRGGSILPTQEPGMTTRECRSNPWGLIAATSLEGTASGNLYVDDGESLVPTATLFVEVCPSFPIFT